MESELFGLELVVGCRGGEVDGALSGADGEAWEDSLEDAAEAGHVGGLLGVFDRKVDLEADY